MSHDEEDEFARQGIVTILQSSGSETVDGEHQVRVAIEHRFQNARVEVHCPARIVERRLAALVARGLVGAALEEQLDRLLVAQTASAMEQRVPGLVTRHHVAAGLIQSLLHQRTPALAQGGHQDAVATLFVRAQRRQGDAPRAPARGWIPQAMLRHMSGDRRMVGGTEQGGWG